jgi:glyoxalase family protein
MQATPAVHGIHHVTVISGDPQENLDFYTGTLGMRLVKKSINQDATDTYHLFYADGAGTPGTDLTFFPWPDLPRATPGAGQVVEVPLAVPAGSLAYWQDRLDAHGVSIDAVETRFGEPTLPFEDPHGLRLTLVETDDARAFEPWSGSAVPAERQIRGMHSARILLHDLGPTEALLTRVLGFEPVGEEGGWHRYAAKPVPAEAGNGGSGRYVEVRADAEAGRGSGGTGGVHHIAWRVHDEAEERALRDVVHRVGLGPTAPIDRFWFKSVYFREPGGVLFELATDGPGFARDEDPEHLGESLILPPWLEGRRAQIEARLPPLTHARSDV